MQLTQTSNRSFIGQIASELGVRFRDVVNVSALRQSFVPAALASAFLSFGITNTAAAAKGQYDAHLSGADGAVAGLNFAHSNGPMTAVESEEKKKDRHFDDQMRLGMLLRDSQFRTAHIAQIVEQFIREMDEGSFDVNTCPLSGKQQIHREDMHGFVGDYMNRNYGIDQNDRGMGTLHRAIETELEGHDIELVHLRVNPYSHYSPFSDIALAGGSEARFNLAADPQATEFYGHTNSDLQNGFRQTAVLAWVNRETARGTVMESQAWIEQDIRTNDMTEYGLA